MNASFLDTNVVVYLFDGGAPEKQRRAQEIVDRDEGQLVLSTQVLQEFYVTATRKLSTPLSPSDAAAVVRELAGLRTVAVDADLVMRAIATSQAREISLWDALILDAAASAGCTRVWSEDLQHGFQHQGLTVQNPFLDER